MCLAVVARIDSIGEGNTAKASKNGIRLEISTYLLENPPRIGDAVLVHVGYALRALDEAEARSFYE